MKLRKLTASAVLSAAALILFTLEAQLPPLTPIPGIKLGVANVVSLFALYALGAPCALGILLVRVVLGAFLTGQVSAILYSLSGGLLSFALSWLLYRRLGAGRVWVLSVLGAMAHNVGQVSCAVLIMQTTALWWYVLPLLMAAIPAGVVTGLAAQQLYKRLGGRYLS